MTVQDLTNLQNLALHVYQEDNEQCEVLGTHTYSISVVYLPRKDELVYIFTSKPCTKVVRKIVSIDDMTILLDNECLIEDEVYNLFHNEICICQRYNEEGYIPF